VTNIGLAAFEDCYSLVAFDVDPLNPAFTSAGGVLFSKDRSNLIAFPARKASDYAIPDGVGTISDYAFAYSTGLTNVEVVIWNRPPSARISGAAVRGNEFGFTILGPSGLVVVVEASRELAHWLPIATKTLAGGSADFGDPLWQNYPSRFYRLRSL